MSEIIDGRNPFLTEVFFLLTEDGDVVRVHSWSQSLLN